MRMKLLCWQRALPSSFNIVSRLQLLNLALSYLVTISIGKTVTVKLIPMWLHFNVNHVYKSVCIYKICNVTQYVRIHNCDQVCENQPCPRTKIATFFSTLWCLNLRFSFANKTKITSHVQKFMENLVKLTE